VSAARGIVFAALAAVFALSAVVCDKDLYLVSRDEAIPPDAVKMTPEADTWPPKLHSDEWEDPIPMPGPVNTAGAEDSPFITPDGDWFFFFFTPDVRVPVNEQLLDGCTGMWWSKREGDSWTEPERVVLNDDVSLDGAQFVFGDTMWFASVRAKGTVREGPQYFIATLRNGEWGNWRNAGTQLNVDYRIGEMHITQDHRTMYCHRDSAAGGYGKYDLWSLERGATGWGTPVNLGPVVNSAKTEGWPWVSSDKQELWFTGDSDSFPGPALYRCKKDSTGNWTAPEPIVSQFAGESTMDDEGNLYFVHHYYATGSRMIEADIYFCRRKKER